MAIGPTAAAGTLCRCGQLRRLSVDAIRAVDFSDVRTHSLEYSRCTLEGLAACTRPMRRCLRQCDAVWCSMHWCTMVGCCVCTVHTANRAQFEADDLVTMPRLHGSEFSHVVHDHAPHIFRHLRCGHGKPCEP